MSEMKQDARPRLSESGRRAAIERERRLAEALRENLRKRKEQVRARRSEPGGAGGQGS